MVNRKKRLKKGIDSINKQIEIHLEKKRVSKEEGKIELEDYYERELKKLERIKDKKEEMLGG